MSKINQEKLAKLAKVTKQTIINWEKDERPVLKLIESYFTNNEIEEFLETQTISKWDFLLKSYNGEKIENSIALRNILEEINKEIEFEKLMNDRSYLNQMFIIFGELILFYRKYHNKYPYNEIYDINELIFLYMAEENIKIHDDIRILNRIFNKHIKNKSFLPFLLELENNNFLDIYNEELYKYSKNDLDLYTIYFIIPFWELKFKNNKIENYEMSQMHHGKVITNYKFDNSLTKRELIKIYTEYLMQLKD